MQGHMYRAVLFAAAALLWSTQILADGIATYFESSANQKPRSNAGLSVQGDRLRLKAGVAMQAPNNRTQIVPNLSSAFTIAKNLDIETRVNLAEWNTRTESGFDTRVQFRSLGPFFDELEGRIWRSPDGLSRQTLKVGFYQILSETRSLTPLTLSGKATVETTSRPGVPTLAGGSDSRRVGVETVLGGLMSPFVTGSNRLSLRLEKVSGARPESASSLAYDQAWTVRNFTKLGFNLKFLRATYTTANELEPSFGFTWRSEF